MKGVKKTPTLSQQASNLTNKLMNTFNFPIDDCQCVQYMNYFIAFTHADSDFLTLYFKQNQVLQIGRQI